MHVLTIMCVLLCERAHVCVCACALLSRSIHSGAPHEHSPIPSAEAASTAEGVPICGMWHVYICSYNYSYIHAKVKMRSWQLAAHAGDCGVHSSAIERWRRGAVGFHTY